jgi:outer membrane lipoprotein SlyB
MKKFLAGLLAMLVFAVAVPLTAEAHNGCPRHRKAKRTYYSRNYRAVQPRYVNYRTAGYTYKRPSFYRRHRNLINLGIATGAGALIGGAFGGKKGALIGTGIGAGSGALYTYVLNKKRRRY